MEITKLRYSLNLVLLVYWNQVWNWYWRQTLYFYIWTLKKSCYDFSTTLVLHQQSSDDGRFQHLLLSLPLHLISEFFFPVKSDFVLIGYYFTVYCILYLECIFQLYRPSSEYLLRQCRFLIRKHQFLELSANHPRQALAYLQTELASTVNHNDPEETKEVGK